MRQPRHVTDKSIIAFDSHVDTLFEKFLVLSWYLAHPDLTDWPPKY